MDVLGTYSKIIWRMTYTVTLLAVTADACSWYTGLVLV